MSWFKVSKRSGHGMKLSALLVGLNVASSRSDAKRLICQGGVNINEVVVSADMEMPMDNYIIKARHQAFEIIQCSCEELPKLLLEDKVLLEDIKEVLMRP